MLNTENVHLGINTAMNAVMLIIFKNGKFLLGKRAEWKSKAPGYWCPISGHIESNETENEAVIREAKEEIGVEVKPIKKITSTPTLDKTVMLHWWLVEIISGKPRINNNENSELNWFDRNELRQLSPTFKEDIDILLNLNI